MKSHALINKYLNGVSSGHNAAEVKYQKHLKETDISVPSSSSSKLRVTKDTQSGQIIRVLQKDRLDDMYLHMPQSSFDIRLSISLEQHKSMNDISSAEIKDKLMQLDSESLQREYECRRKDRLVYTVCDGEFELDLTQVVQQSSQNSGSTNKHEVEIEWLDMKSVIREAELADQGQANALLAHMQKLLGISRLLVQKASF